MNKIKIVHLTSVHSRYDTRIFLKECTSLANAGFETSLVVADGGVDEQINGVNIFGVSKAKNMLGRIIKSTKTVYDKAIEIEADVYHIHDPELIFYGLKLLKKRKKVIFDAHEDFPNQLKSKPYLNKLSRLMLAWIAKRVEQYAFKKFSLLIGATPVITEKLKHLNKNSICINNYPLLGELDNNVDWSYKKNELCYVGGITKIRGIVQLIKAMEYVDEGVSLNLVGSFMESNLLDVLQKEKGWEKVNYLGLLSRKGVSEILSKSKIGIVTFLNAPNHVDSQPNKMFEYMSSGIPVIGSDFFLWRKILEDNRCGFTIDPLNPNEIAQKITELINNDSLAKQMGENGKKVVTSIYNWKVEEKKLIKEYKKIIQ